MNPRYSDIYWYDITAGSLYEAHFWCIFWKETEERLEPYNQWDIDGLTHSDNFDHHALKHTKQMFIGGHWSLVEARGVGNLSNRHIL